MTTPTSYPRQSPSKPSNYLTPAPASSPPPPPSSHSNTSRNNVSSPIHLSQNLASKRPLHIQNGHVRGPSQGGGTPMARSGTNTSAQGGTSMVPTATNGSAATPVARTVTSASVDSPAVTAATAMLMDNMNMPRGLGLTPQGMGTGLTPLGLQMQGGSSVGGIAGMGAQDQEEERRRRIEAIVGMLGGRWGFVGQEGVERCAKRLGLECLWEEGMGLGEEKKRALSIAGHGLLIEVDFEGDEVVDVILSLPGCGDAEGKQVARGSQILKNLLKGDDQDKGYMQLEPFAGNLERLARMDQLGGESLNCFDAVDGIYKSLDRVFRWETESLKNKQLQASPEMVLCIHSGRPFRNFGKRIGLACQFWMEQRSSFGGQGDSEAMDVDGMAAQETEDNPFIWSAIIECEACPAELYPPIRISNNWVSEAVEKPASQELDELHISSTNIDWLEVPATMPYIKESTEPANGKIMSETPEKQPDARFVAKFEPPLVMPLQTAMNIHQSLGSPIAQEIILPTGYGALVFADIDPQNHTLTSPRTIDRTVVSYDPVTGNPSTHTHTSTLYTPPQDFARIINELPFKHPMQLIALLPTFRQWALTGSILRRSFTLQPKEATTNGASPSHEDNANHPDEPAPDGPIYQTLEEELADFLATPSTTGPSSSSAKEGARAIDISLITASGSPHFNIHFPNPRYGGKLANITFNVGLNGTVEGVDIDDGAPPVAAVPGNEQAMSEREKEKVEVRDRVQKVLEIGEDLGVLIEWICRG